MSKHVQLVTHDQHTYYKGGTLGTYTVRYAQQKKQNWDIWLRLFHWTGPCVTPPCPEPVDTPNPKVKPMIGEKTIITNAHTNKNYEAMNTDKGIYIIPSDSHLNKQSIQKENSLYTFKSLQSLMYDKELDTLVRNFSGFSVGDKIYFYDTIQSISYDKDRDETFFGFEDFEGQITEWPFKGDLRDEYNEGDSIHLTFEIVQETSVGPFETLDYIKYGLENDSKAPAIEDFLNK